MNHSFLVSTLPLPVALFTVVPPVGSLFDVTSLWDDLWQNISIALVTRAGHTIGCHPSELVTAVTLMFSHSKLLVTSKSVVLLPALLAAGYQLPCRDVFPP